MLRINRKEQSAPAHCSWYVFILGGVAIHLTVCVSMCVLGPEANSTRLCIHYLPRCSTMEWLPMGTESVFITESVSVDQRLPPRQSMLFLFQLGQISCHPATRMLLFCASWIYERQIICMSQVQWRAKGNLAGLLPSPAAAVHFFSS